MADFLFAFYRTCSPEIEGGYTERYPEGATNRGVVLRALKEMGMWGDFDGNGDVDKEDLKIMDVPHTAEFYRLRYWEPGGWGRIDANLPAWKVFDAHVNMGLWQASLIFQRALRRCGRLLEIDGRVGRITITEANRTNPTLLLNAMRQEMAHVYMMILKAHPELEKYRAGWFRRAAA